MKNFVEVRELVLAESKHNRPNFKTKFINVNAILTFEESNLHEYANCYLKIKDSAPIYVLETVGEIKLEIEEALA